MYLCSGKAIYFLRLGCSGSSSCHSSIPCIGTDRPAVPAVCRGGSMTCLAKRKQ